MKTKECINAIIDIGANILTAITFILIIIVSFGIYGLVGYLVLIVVKFFRPDFPITIPSVFIAGFLSLIILVILCMVFKKFEQRQQ